MVYGHEESDFAIVAVNAGSPTSLRLAPNERAAQ
jgi:hypothetical protein